MKPKKLVISLILCLLLSSLNLQSQTQVTPPNNETISLNKNISLNDALIVIESLSVRESGKKIYNMSQKNPQLGIPLNNVTWQEAINLICIVHGLVQEDKPGMVMIKPGDVEKEVMEDQLTKRQIKITARVLEVKKTFAESFGIDWSSVINGAIQYSGDLAFYGATKVGGDMVGASVSSTTESGDNTIQIDALVKALEENQEGEILAKPSIYVDSGKQGYIQVGKDFSIKTVDENGNTTDQFFSTGVILDVTPTIIKDRRENEAINLEIKVERSSAIPGELSTEITKSKATSSITIYDGEETAIGGLYDKDETIDRGGIPILKDLPWWVFGLRYIFGYSKTSYTEKELVIFIKAEIMEPILQRRDKENG